MAVFDSGSARRDIWIRAGLGGHLSSVPPRAGHISALCPSPPLLDLTDEGTDLPL